MDKERNKKADYEVGYGKPPKSTRFKSGESGNPAGRPRGTLNLGTIVQKQLAEKLDVFENGRPRRISKLEVVFKSLFAKAAKGDVRATELLFKQFLRAEGDEGQHQEAKALSEDDNSIIERYLACRKKRDDN